MTRNMAEIRLISMRALQTAHTLLLEVFEGDPEPFPAWTEGDQGGLQTYSACTEVYDKYPDLPSKGAKLFYSGIKLHCFPNRQQALQSRRPTVLPDLERPSAYSGPRRRNRDSHMGGRYQSALRRREPRASHRFPDGLSPGQHRTARLQSSGCRLRTEPRRERLARARASASRTARGVAATFGSTTSTPREEVCRGTHRFQWRRTTYGPHRRKWPDAEPESASRWRPGEIPGPVRSRRASWTWEPTTAWSTSIRHKSRMSAMSQTCRWSSKPSATFPAHTRNSVPSFASRFARPS